VLAPALVRLQRSFLAAADEYRADGEGKRPPALLRRDAFPSGADVPAALLARSGSLA
jgi:hypothetical protein